MVVSINIDIPQHCNLCQLSQCYSVIIDRGISAPGYGKYVVDGLNSIYKRYIYQLISNVQLLGSKTFYSYILMHSCTEKNDVSLDRILKTFV